jgi:hypothetical protein
MWDQVTKWQSTIREREHEMLPPKQNKGTRTLQPPNSKGSRRHSGVGVEQVTEVTELIQLLLLLGADMAR